MAFPDIPTVAGGRVLTGTQADASGTRTFPSLTGLTKNAGDLLIALIYGYGSSTSNVWSGWGAGFTEFLDLNSTGISALGCAYKFSTGSETGTFTVTHNTPSGHAAMILLAISGAHSSTPPYSVDYAFGTSTAADPSAPAATTWGAADNLWISFAGIGETSTGGAFGGLTSGPTNYSNDVLTGISGDVVGGAQAGVSFRQLNTDLENVGPWSLDVSNARNAAHLVAIRPYALPPGPSSLIHHPAHRFLVMR